MGAHNSTSLFTRATHDHTIVTKMLWLVLRAGYTLVLVRLVQNKKNST